jgi:hypothetical protein
MSYDKAMKHSIRKSRKQVNNHFGFTTLATNERREFPALGGVWFEPDRDDERAAFIANWKSETARMLVANPKLKII